MDEGRRRTIKALALGALAASPLARVAAAAVPGPLPGAKSAPGGATVARAQREGLLKDGQFDAAKLDAALGAAVARAAGEATPRDACRKLFRKTDVVAIKVNCIARRGLSSRPEVAAKLVSWLKEAGVPARNILVFDRTDAELVAAGYTLNRGGDDVRVFGTQGDYEPNVREWGPSASRFPTFLAQDVTAVINLCVLKEHGLAGASLGMKNWYGVVHNPNKLHADNGRPFIPQLASFPLINDKLRLTVVDGGVGQCEAGPMRNPRWQWPFAGFLASTDVAALDFVGWKILEDRRREVGLPSFKAEGREPLYILDAAKLGLGEADPARIKVEVV